MSEQERIERLELLAGIVPEIPLTFSLGLGFVEATEPMEDTKCTQPSFSPLQ